MPLNILFLGSSLLGKNLLELCIPNVNITFAPNINLTKKIEAPIKKESPRAFIKRTSQNNAILVRDGVLGINTHMHEEPDNNPENSVSKGAFYDKKNSIIISTEAFFCVGTMVIGQAQNIEDTKRYMNIISGRRVNIFTSITVIDKYEKINTKILHTVLKIKRLTKKEISWYLLSNGWLGKVGGMDIQGKASVFIQFIRGSYSPVIGIPIYELSCILQSSGIKLF